MKVQRTVAPANMIAMLIMFCIWTIQGLAQNSSFSERPPLGLATIFTLLAILNFGAVLLTVIVLYKERRNPDVTIVFEKPDPLMRNLALISLINLVLRWNFFGNEIYFVVFAISAIVYCVATCFDNERNIPGKKEFIMERGIENH